MNRGRHLTNAAVLLSLSLTLFSPGLFLNQLPAYRDLLVLTLPFREYTAQALLQGEFPLWSPDLFFGAPFFANWQSGVLYPFTLLFVLVPLPESLSLYLAFHVFVAAFGAERFLAVTLRVRQPAALFGGIVFGFGGFLFSLLSLTNQLAAGAWLPWAMLAANSLIRLGTTAWFFALIIFLLLQLLCGAPEASLLTYGLIVAYTLYQRASPIRIAAVGLAITGAALLAAVQLIPTLEYLHQTDRADTLPLTAVTAESLEGKSFLQFVLPHTFEGGAPGFSPEGGIPLFWSLYLGIVPLVFILASLWPRPPSFWILMAAGATLLGLGSNAFLVPMLYSLLPDIVGVFRFPAKFFLVAHFALSILAAVGFGRILESGRARQVAGVTLGLLVAVGILITATAPAAPEAVLRALGYDLPPNLTEATYRAIAASVSAKGIRLISFSLLAGLLLILFAHKRVSGFVFTGLLILLTAVDLITVHQPALAFVNWPSLRQREAVLEESIEPGQRVFHYSPASQEGLDSWLGKIRIAEPVGNQARALWTALIPNLPILHGVSTIAAVDGFTPHHRNTFYRTLAQLPRDHAVRLLGALGVHRLVGPSPLESSGLRLVSFQNSPTLYVYSPTNLAPRSYLATRTFRADTPIGALVRVASPDFRPGRDAVLAGSAKLPPTSDGKIENVFFGRLTIRATISVRTAGLWVISDTWYPGWKSTIDGQPTETLKVNGIVRGVAVPPGRHLVEMSYRPASFLIGVIVSTLALTALIIGMIGTRKWRPRLGGRTTPSG